MANSKRKGNRFELLCSKWFTRWTKFTWNRVPMSGAWHSNPDAASDITCVDERHAHRCKINVECKFYKDINFEHLLLGTKTCKILKFWEQACEDSQRVNKVPILCMRYNSMPREEFFIVVDQRLRELFLDCSRQMDIYIKGYALSIFMATDVIDTINYSLVHKKAKALVKK